MKIKLFGILFILAVVLTGCKEAEETTKDSAEGHNHEQEHVVIDDLGREVTIPENLERVVAANPWPFYSAWFVGTNSTEEIIALNPGAYDAAEASILKDISPEILNASTAPFQSDSVNIEELIKLNPQLYFANSTDVAVIEKLEEAGVNVYALPTMDNTEGEPLSLMNKWLEIIGAITGKEERTQELITAGDAAMDEVGEKIADVKEEDKPRVLFLFNHSENEIIVPGKNHYGNQWIKATGGIDVAEEIEGTQVVNMEQIYEWNPDIIYITNFTETQPEDLLNNTVVGQDWSKVTAVKEAQVYKVPLGIYRWYTASGDGPLMLKWMALHNHPELFNYDMKAEIKDYYSEFYNFEPSDEQVERILKPSSEAGA